MASAAGGLDALLHNTVSVTGLHGSDKINVIPSEVTAELDGRLLPDFRPEDLIAELHQIVGQDVAFEVTRHEPGPGRDGHGAVRHTLAGILQEMDPGGAPVPLLLSGYTDARVFSQLGIQTYGFNPMQLPEEFDFSKGSCTRPTSASRSKRSPSERTPFTRCCGDLADGRVQEHPASRIAKTQQLWPSIPLTWFQG